MGRFLKTAAALSLLVTLGAAQADPVFQGRLADGTRSSTCTVSGADKCAMFYSTTLDLTILNDWLIGIGTWDAAASAGSVQRVAEVAGAAQTDFTGWSLPTGDGSQSAGALNQYRAIWNDVGGSIAGLQAQFDRVGVTDYWSASDFAPDPTRAWVFGSWTGYFVDYYGKAASVWVVAVRPGDVATAVPEPATSALVAMALLGIAAARGRRPLAPTA